LAFVWPLNNRFGLLLYITI